MNSQDRQILLDLANASIRNGLATGKPLKADPAAYSAELREVRATFVTLHKRGELRGCIGRLTATRPLVEDVAENAFAAAFKDYRFSPLAADEFGEIDLHLSILTVPEPIEFTSEADLLAQIRPFEDGLILEEGGRSGTFLPSVWNNLPDPVQFLKHLKQKAGLPADYWSNSLRCYRYRTESFG